MKRCAYRLLCLLTLLSLLVGCKAKSQAALPDAAPTINPPVKLPAAIADYPQIAERNPAVEDAYRPIAENADLRLYLKQASSAILVEDKRSGFIWRSSPADLADNKGTTTNWRKQIEVPIQVTYVDSERSQPKNVKPDKTKVEFTPVKDGVMATYTFTGYDLSLSVIYSIQGDCLQAAIPETSVKEKGINSLVSIDLLAFLGATHEGDPGYIVYPDGSGALMDYSPLENKDVQKINSIVYGEDTPSNLLNTTESVYHEQIAMPVFGLVSNNSAFLGIITNGDFDASIAIAHSGKGINYNHVWAQFVFRRQGRFSLTGGQPTWIFQPDLLGGDRQVRYCFLNDKEANYVGMATRYRDFLIKEHGAKRVADQPPLLHVALLMGIERRTWFLADMISMTSFNEAKQMVQDLAAAGVKKMDVTLWFWNRGGTGFHYPQRLPVDSRLGSEQDLRSLADDLHQRGERLYLSDDYLSAAPGSRGVFPYLDAIRGVDGLPVGSAENGYLLNPQVSWRKFAMVDIPKMEPFGPNGLEFANFGSLTIPDKNSQFPLSREGFAATWMKITELSRKDFGSAAVEGSNIYTVPYADRLDFTTTDSTHYDIFSETIPFYQIAVHGLTQYTGQPFNLISDGKRMFLHYVEYGAIPFFLLTHESSAKLMRTMVNGIYSSQYSFWRDEVISQYQAMEKLAPVANQFITDHSQLAPDVYQTTYENGVRVIVNYNSTPYISGSLTVGPQDFAVVPGE